MRAATLGTSVTARADRFVLATEGWRRRRRARRELESLEFVATAWDPTTAAPASDAGATVVSVSELRVASAAHPSTINDAVARETAGHVVVIDAAAGAGQATAQRLAQRAQRCDAALATALIAHPLRRGLAATPFDARVRCAGLDLVIDDADRPVAVARDAGASVAALAPDAVSVDAAGWGCVVVERASFASLGGLRGDDLDAAFFDLSLRANAAGMRVVVDPAVVVVDRRPVLGRAALTTPIDPEGDAWRWLVRQHGAALHRLHPAGAGGAPGATLRVALTCAAPSRRAASRWGDWHLADALGRALERAGVRIHLATLDHVDDAVIRACDVHLVVRGLAPVEPSPGQRQVLWIISHPETVTDAELDRADLVLCASTPYAQVLRARTATPIEVLLQATDPSRFAPEAAGTPNRRGRDVVVVAKTRGVVRRSVLDAHAAGLRPTIYGSGWRGVVPREQIAAEHVPNADLASVYARAGVVLNDHWDSMRDHGFVSNRIFDVLACGTPVVSDPVAGLDAIFEGLVPTWESPEELGEIVRSLQADPRPALEAAGRARELVLAHHTFDHRASEILAALRTHGLIDPGS